MQRSEAYNRAAKTPEKNGWTVKSFYHYIVEAKTEVEGIVYHQMTVENWEGRKYSPNSASFMMDEPQAKIYSALKKPSYPLKCSTFCHVATKNVNVFYLIDQHKVAYGCAVEGKW